MVVLVKSPSHKLSSDKNGGEAKIAKNELQQVQDAFLCPQRRVQSFVQRAAHPIFYNRKAKKLLDGCLEKRVPFARYISSTRAAGIQQREKRENLLHNNGRAPLVCARGEDTLKAKYAAPKCFSKRVCVCASAFLFAQRLSWGRNLIWPYSPWDLHDALTVCAASTTHHPLWNPLCAASLFLERLRKQSHFPAICDDLLNSAIACRNWLHILDLILCYFYIWT